MQGERNRLLRERNIQHGFYQVTMRLAGLVYDDKN